MRKYITRLIPVLWMVGNALMVVLRDFSWQLALVALAMVAVPAFFVFRKEEQTLAEQLPVLLVGLLLVGLVLPVFPFGAEAWTDGLAAILNMDGYIDSHDLAVPLLLLLIVLQLFFRKKKKPILVLIRYVVLFCVLNLWHKALFPAADVYYEVLLLLTVLFMLREMRALKQNDKKAGMLPCILLAALLFYLPAVAGMGAAWTIQSYLLQTEDSWLRNQILIFALAALLWADQQTRFPDGKLAEKQLAQGLFAWGVLYLVMQLWPSIRNYEVLLLWFPLCFEAMQSIRKKFQLHPVVLWGIALVVLLAQAKSFEMRLFFAPALMLYLLTVSLFWNKQEKLGKSRFAALMGILGLLVLASVRQGVMGTLILTPEVVLLYVVSGLSWCLITDHLGKMNGMSSQGHRQEFTRLMDLMLPVSLAPMVLALVKVLFVL